MRPSLALLCRSATKQHSPEDYQAYNRVAEFLSSKHEGFRSTLDYLHSSCLPDANPTSSTKFIKTGLAFCRRLHRQHAMEEARIYTPLGKRMPQFGRESKFLHEHKVINIYSGQFARYLMDCTNNKKQLDLRKALKHIDKFRTKIVVHFETEVRSLRPDVMREFWTLEEMRRGVIKSETLKVRELKK